MEMEIRQSLYTILILATVACSTPKMKTISTATTSADYRLHDIWVLKEMNGKILTTDDYAKEAPRMEINVKDKKVMGYTSCNNFFGGLLTEADKITFSDLASTRMFCEKSVENEFLKALEEAERFEIKDLHLLLYKDQTLIAKFLKVD